MAELKIDVDHARQTYMVPCRQCRQAHALKIDPADISAWEGGKLIQDAMPYLSKAERELLISATCNDCWVKLYGEPEDHKESNDDRVT